MLRPGTVVDGQFRITCSVGSGAQATVYRAVDLNLQRTVALKMMHTDDGELANEQRFQREARLISLLQHPNILRCYKFGHFERSLYTCMDFFNGVSLAKVLQDGPMPWRRASKICLKVAHGMQHAHANGVVHRDLTPRNIMISEGTTDADQVKVVDFGLGKWLDADASRQKLTQTGYVIGSIHCMSPEQCSGKEADGRSDVYSLGCVLYNCLTGEPPFVALETFALMQQHLFEEPSPPSALAGSNCPTAMDKVLARSLAKSPDDRYQSMAEFASDLDAVLEGKNLSNATASFIPAHQSRRRNEIMVWVMVAGILILSAVMFKMQIISSMLALMPSVAACSIATQVVQGAAPLSQAERTEIATQGARIAESAKLCSPEAVILYARSDGAGTSTENSIDSSHGTLMALQTLLYLSRDTSKIPPMEFRRLASVTLNEIPSRCRNHHIGRMCFEIVPMLDEPLARRYIRKGLDITDTASDQGGLALIRKLFEYSSHLKEKAPPALREPIRERCLEALRLIPPNEPGRAMGCYVTASMLDKDDSRRFALLVEGSHLARAGRELSPPFLKGQRQQMYCWTAFAYRNRKDYENARKWFLATLEQEEPLPAQGFTDNIADLSVVTALVSGPASGREVLKRFQIDPERAANYLSWYLPGYQADHDRSEQLMVAEMLIALPVKTRNQALLYVNARLHKARCLEENQQFDKAEREYRAILDYLKADRLISPEDKADRIANATLSVTQLVSRDRSPVKEAR